MLVYLSWSGAGASGRGTRSYQLALGVLYLAVVLIHNTL